MSRGDFDFMCTTCGTHKHAFINNFGDEPICHGKAMETRISRTEHNFSTGFKGGGRVESLGGQEDYSQPIYEINDVDQILRSAMIREGRKLSE
jgi:hypothetical protein